MVMLSRRIPAGNSREFKRWNPPDVAEGVVVKAETVRREVPRSDEIAAQTSTWSGQSMEQQVVDNIKAGRYAAGVSARDLEKIVLDAVREGHKDGFAEGFALGKEQGHAEGVARGEAEGRARVEEQARRLSRLADALHNPLREQEQALRGVMLDAIVHIARSVVRAELSINPQSIAAVVSEALASLPLGAANVQVFLCESDHALMTSNAAPDEALTLCVDATLEPGDCRVESRESLVEFTLAGRFEAMVAQLIGYATPAVPAEPFA
jgi:flagellar assembly protein FliH